MNHRVELETELLGHVDVLTGRIKIADVSFWETSGLDHDSVTVETGSGDGKYAVVGNFHDFGSPVGRRCVSMKITFIDLEYVPESHDITDSVGRKSEPHL